MKKSDSTTILLRCLTCGEHFVESKGTRRLYCTHRCRRVGRGGKRNQRLLRKEK